LIGNKLTIVATAEERLAVRVGFVAAHGSRRPPPALALQAVAATYRSVGLCLEVISLQLLVVDEVVVRLGWGGCGGKAPTQVLALSLTARPIA
jgi:hypothetical protein